MVHEAENTDKELWRATSGDYYSKHRLYVTDKGALTLCEGGHCITMHPDKWFELARSAHKKLEALHQELETLSKQLECVKETPRTNYSND